MITSAGHPNYGDELIVRKWLQRIALTHPDAEVWLDSPNPGVSAALFSDLHLDLRCTDTLWQICLGAPSDAPSSLSRFVSDTLTTPDATNRLLPGIRNFGRADIVHLLGGGFVNSIWCRNLGLLAALWWASHRPGITTAATGAGLVPAAAPRGLLTELFAQVDVVDLRDRASADLIGDLAQATMNGDDAVLDFASHADPSGLPDTMVCLQGDLVAIDREELIAWTLSVLRQWGVNDEPIGFIECIPGVDRQAFDDMVPYLPKARMYTLWDLLDDGFPARPNQRWIATRFHPHLLAAAAGASGVAVTIDPVYYRNKHKSLIDAGTGWAMATTDDGALRDPAHVDATRSTDLGQLLSVAAKKSALADRLYGPSVR
jgi:polysaccharide pyruvyl transferase WcaK-like protein